MSSTPIQVPFDHTEMFNQLFHQMNARLDALSRHPVAYPQVTSPEKYDGNAAGYHDFLASVDNVFALQPERFSIAEFKTRYIGTLLIGNAKSWFRHICMNDSDKLRDFAAFMADFQSQFRDPNYHMQCRARLAALRQGKGSVQQYQARFRVLANDTGYNETALLNIFYEGLSDQVKDLLSTVLDLPERLEEFIRLTIKIDQRLHTRWLEKRKEYTRPSHSHSAAQSNRMDLDATSFEQGNRFGQLNVSREEYERRKRAGQCLGCGEKNHRVKDCPKRRMPKNEN